MVEGATELEEVRMESTYVLAAFYFVVDNPINCFLGKSQENGRN